MNKIVETICEAWEAKNPALLYEILADEFTWYDSPFENAVTDRKSLVERWKQDISAQENVRVSSDIISQNDDLVVTHWRAEFDRNKAHEVLDGVFMIRKEGEKLVEFRMWWVSSE